MHTEPSKKAANRITEGVIWKQLLIFFFPILVGTFFQQLYNTVDAIVVGRFVGKEALAAIGGSSGQILQFVIGFFTGLTSGMSVSVSQFYGAGDREALNDHLHTAYAFSILGGIILSVLGIIFSKKLLLMMNTPSELMKSSLTYLHIAFAGILFMLIYNMGSAVLRALGDSKRPLIYLVICCFINIVLDLLFVLVFKMGVAGAAIATLIAQAVSAILVTAALMRSDDIYRLELGKIKIHMHALKKQLYIGVPGGLQSTMYNIANIMTQTAINNFGTDTAAAWAAYGKLDGIFWMISGAYGIAITTFVGQNFGAGKMDRVRKSIRTSILMYTLSTLVLAAFFIPLRSGLFGIFTSDPHVVQIGSDMLMVIAPFYITFMLVEIFSGALRGLNDVIIPMLITMFGICAFRVFWLLVIVPLNPSINRVIVNYPITWILTSVLFTVYYMMRRKKLQ